MGLLQLPSAVMASILQRLTSDSRRGMRQASRGLRAFVDMHIDKLRIQLRKGSDAEWVARRLAGSELRPASLHLSYSGESSLTVNAAFFGGESSSG